MKSLALITALSVILTLVSCGGGKSEQQETSSPYIKIENKLVYFQAAEGGPTETYGEELKFKVLDAEGSIFIQVKNNNPELVERTELIPASTNGDASLTVYAAQPYLTKLTKGTHQGTIELSLCMDRACNEPVAFSTVTISVVFDIL